MSFEEKDDIFSVVTDTCLQAFQDNEEINVLDLSIKIMDKKDFPMHAPVHHYLVPAVLLTAARKSQGHGVEVLERDLNEALVRAKQVPGGSCGFFGTCGACVGCGIFFSLITDSSPCSTKTWALANRATSYALEAISNTGGPRCCKRCTWLSLLSTREQIEEKLKLNLVWSDKEDVICKFYDRNKECIKGSCPFYPLKEEENENC